MNQYKYLYIILFFVFLCFQSCVSENPFSNDEDGVLKLSTAIKEEVKTRAYADYDHMALVNSCVIYIESQKGLIRKYKGLDQVPSSITLKPGSYVVEGWAGDSVSASFDKKFYRGYQKFSIESGQENNLSFACNIANTLVSVTPESLEQGIKDVKVTFSHSKGSLEFDEEKIKDGNKGYFMMPNADPVIRYKVEGTMEDGTTYTQEGVINEVQRAHEYRLNLTANPTVNPYGGAMVKISIEDIEVVTEEVYIYGKPSIIAYIGNEVRDLEDQIIGSKEPSGDIGEFNDVVVRVRGYEGLITLQLRGGENFALIGHKLANSADLLREEDTYPTSELNQDGIYLSHSGPFYGPGASTTPDGGKMWMQYEITFKKEFFDNLPASETEYKVYITATDFQDLGLSSQTTRAVMHIANTEKAETVKAPVQTDAINLNSNPMAVLSTTATLTATIKVEGVDKYGFKYREKGMPNWITVLAGEEDVISRSLNITRAIGDKYSVTLTGLKPGTTYEYKAYQETYDNCNIYEFTTESPFIIPNSSMENWSNYKDNSKVILPSSDGIRNFWDSGNHGSATLSVTLTQGSDKMNHTEGGRLSAELTSKEVAMFGIGKFAAGNLFAGEYVGTDGTDGILSFGRPYNGSHPTALRVYVNYRPKVGSGIGANSSYIGNGALDQGQIYVALSTEPVEIRTKSSNQKLFNPEDNCILAYGQVTFINDFGSDGSLQKVEIPLEYYERAKSTPAKYLIIVASASKYGDFFSGGPGSVMYLDDFELVYE